MAKITARTVTKIQRQLATTKQEMARLGKVYHSHISNKDHVAADLIKEELRELTNNKKFLENELDHAVSNLYADAELED